MQSDAVFANNDKAIALINGRKLSRDETFSLMHALGSLTADQGWQIAPSSGWLYLTNDRKPLRMRPQISAPISPAAA